MSFAVTFRDAKIDDPQALMLAVADAPPSLPELVSLLPQLSTQQAAGFSVAMMRVPKTLGAGAELALLLSGTEHAAELCSVLVLALSHHDPSVVIHQEDHLLRLACRLFQGDNPQLRRALVARFRQASNHQLELQFLAEHGQAEDFDVALDSWAAEGGLDTADQALVDARLRDIGYGKPKQ